MQSRNLAYLPRLDHLRLLAVLLVFSFHLYHHAWHHWRPNPGAAWLGPIVEGHTGVSLFFVISGFIFMLIGHAGPIDYRSFLANRLLRIAPLFLVVFMFAASLGRDTFAATDVFYLLFSNIGKPPTSNFFVTGTAWTIGVEFTFYLAFPFICRFFLQQGWRYMGGLLLVLAVLKLTAYFIVANPTHFYYSTLVGRFDQFLVGMMAARLYLEHREALARRAWLLLAASSAWIYAGLWFMARHASFMAADGRQPAWIGWSFVEALGWAGVVLGYLLLPAARGSWAGAIDRLAQQGGRTSFSFYLLHTCVLFLAFELTPVPRPTPWFPLNFALVFLPVFAACWALATVSFHCIEKPFLQMRKRYVLPPAD